ncbi:hypothetical protein ACFQNF_01195 [Iodobacter arcticus]|uniref:LITAF domain-containing protein n=1 Tax=Iodobacter arcticus TaxID=590593 RepID=A0ABW2QTW4_9NEIS
MMQHISEIRHCSVCGVDTNHVVVLVRKTNPFKGEQHSKFKEFLHGAIKSWFLGAFIASMDEFSRHRICEKCGNKVIED